MKLFDNKKYLKHNFDIHKFDFAARLGSIINISKELLPYIHKLNDKHDYINHEICTLCHEDKSFISLYKAFINEDIKKIFGYTRVVYQRFPNIKIYYPGFHRFNGCLDKHIKQNDGDTITIILPFTSMYDTNTIWLEKEYASGVLEPVNISYGEYLAFCQQNLARDFYRNSTPTTTIFLEFMFTSYSSYKNTINSLIIDNTASMI